LAFEVFTRSGSLSLQEKRIAETTSRTIYCFNLLFIQGIL
jgi:hypothetical protein